LNQRPEWNDVERGRTKINVKGVPRGEYRSIRFYVGLAEADNVREVVDYPADHPLNPNLNGLHWSWQTGYIFLAFEGHVGGEKGFSYHLARAPNRTRIDLGLEFDGAGSKMLVLDFDVEALLNAPHALSFMTDGISTHSREGDPVVGKLTANLSNALRVRQMIDLSPMALVKKEKAALYLPAERTEHEFHFNRRLPLPALPEDNPLFAERVALGEMLFHETRLSKNNEMACSTCHVTKHALTDPRRFSVGVDGQVGSRNAMPLFNLVWKNHFFWDGRATSLREQALIPIEDPTEMAETLDAVVNKLEALEKYQAAFAAAFDPPKITSEKIGLALEQFMISQLSYRSRYDRAIQGAVRLTPQEQRGFSLFVTEFEPRSGQYGADCFHCHGGTLFTDNQFHNNGLVPTEDLGRFAVTRKPGDRHKFVTPSLRNVELTAPYMHDGRFSTLEEVVAHYDHGLHRSETLDPNLAKHPPEGLELSAEDQAALVAFLKTLTDKEFVRE
jgi:cytochrome c peroxidase